MKFSIGRAVFHGALSSKSNLKEVAKRPKYRVSFLLVRFLWTSKENEQEKQ